MRTAMDYSPLYRSVIGLDRLIGLLDEAMRVAPAEAVPPYDIEKTGEDHYRITMAVAGFGPENIEITAEPNVLRVRGRRPAAGDTEILHRGIALGDFERRFELADHVRVDRASLQDGLLRIDLVREMPEAMKPRRIEIATGPGLPRTEQPKQIEQKAA